MKNAVYAVLFVLFLSIAAGILLAFGSLASGQTPQTYNPGPNIQYPQPPANPAVQSIHPK